ncbi:MAG TPA: hypothetical protein VKB09_06955, partial [Thermomicrobiales bacterium]|nr:hypothetical protein [Thermomicrobiales bacterium]
MASPDRDDADQEHSDGTAASAGDDQPRRRVRVKSPVPPPRHAQPRARGEDADRSGTAVTPGTDLHESSSEPEGSLPAFVAKGEPPLARVAGDEAPRHAPELGLGWLGSTNGVAEPGRAERSPRLVHAPRKTGTRVEPDLHGYQQVQGSHLGDRYVRVVRQHGDDFSRAGP